MIVPGDRIDLMASARRDNKTYLFAVMQNTPVLATGSRIVPEPEAKDGRRTYTTITIEATPEQAQRVLAARELGKLAAMLRAPGDAAQSSGAKRDAMALLGIGEAGPVSDGSVPVLYGGRVGANNVGRMPVLNTAATTANSDK
jgi:pilus assembly protein CpaB